MAKDERKRQQMLQRHAAKRKQKQQHRTASAPLVARPSLRLASSWPFYECLVSRDWEKEGEIVQVLVARRSPQGEIGVAVFLVDLGCLGVKNALADIMSPGEYQQGLRAEFSARQRMRDVDVNLAAKIVRESITYAHRFGFSPHPDYYLAAPMLEGADPDAVKERVPVGGKDGKPYFIAGPYDNVPRILAQLERAVGPGNFNYTVPLGPGPAPF